MFKSLLRGPLIIIFALILSFSSSAQTLPNIPVEDQFGSPGRIRDHLKGESLLVLGFYHCKHVCHFMVKNLSRSLKQAQSYPHVVFLSIDETEGPRDALALRKKIIGPDKENWSFLLSDKDSIARLAKDLKFSMNRDPASGVITHEVGIYTIKNGTLLNKISKLDLTPEDLNFQTGPEKLVHKIKLFCSQFDPTRSKYGVQVLRFLTLMCGIFLVAAGTGYYYLRKTS